MNEIPQHLGIIMDGNRRWAKARRLPEFLGHKAGAEVLRRIIKHCQKKGIKNLTVFAFSTENWQRSEKEVNYLMTLCQAIINRDLKELTRNGVRVKIIGEKHMLPRMVVSSLAKAEEFTKGNKGIILNIALSYGGRAEIVSIIRDIIRKKIPAEKVTEEFITENLSTPGLDLLIRTGKELRSSNFLIWQAAYAELYFSEKYWPDFTEEDLDKALDDFAERKRRYGK